LNEEREMKQLYYRVEDPQGLHVRPCVKLARFFRRWECHSIVEYESKTVSGKDGTALLKLEVPQGDLLLFTVNGQQETEAYQQLKGVLQQLSEQNYQ
jgi:phosphotransferase system HPr (HPr) family protein